MDTKFSRDAFLDGEDRGADLADALSEHLTVRLRTSREPLGEVEKIVGELRALGHELSSLDASEESAFWGGDYVAQHYRNRFVIAFWYPSSGQPIVGVIFRRWLDV